MSKMKRKKQLNVVVDEALLKDVADDASHFKKTKDGIVEAALRQLFCLKREHRAQFYKYLPRKVFGRPLLAAALLLTLSGCEPAYAGIINEQKLADAIRIEEGNNPHYFYGVHHKGTTPLTEPEARRRCINTIRSAERDFSGSGNFITFLSLRYCPANHQSWASNVSKLYNK
jgi:hypothetical protein